MSRKAGKISKKINRRGTHLIRGKNGNSKKVSPIRLNAKILIQKLPRETLHSVCLSKPFSLMGFFSHYHWHLPFFITNQVSTPRVHQ